MNNFITKIYYLFLLLILSCNILFSQQNLSELRKELQVRSLYTSIINEKGEIFAGTWGAGVWKSTDDGRNWSRYSEGLESYDIRKLIIVSGRIFSITGEGVYYSDDSGLNWFSVPSLQKTNAYRNIIQVGNTLVIVDDNGAVYNSDLNGLNWNKVGNIPEKILIAPFSLTSDKKILIGTEKGLYESSDHGKIWEKLNNFISNQNIIDIKNIKNILFFLTFNNGLFISKDNGKTITALNDGLGTKKVKFISSSVDGSIVLSTFDNGVYVLDEEREVWKKSNFDYTSKSLEFISFKKGNIIAGSSSGSVFMSSDGGINWSELPNKLIVARPNDIFIYIKASDKIEKNYLPPPIELYKNRQNKTNAATITVTYTGFSAEAQAAFQYAVDIWASLITSSVPIKVNATYTSLGAGVLGSAGPATAYSGFMNQPYSNTWYPVALAEKINGSGLNLSTSPDIVANFNSDFSNWYFGTDGNTPFNKYDFVSVVLHELCHGLGYVGSFSYSGGVGSWGDATYHYPYIFDRFLYNGSSQWLMNTGIFPNPSTNLGTQLTSNNVWWTGPNTGTVRMYAPAAWSSGSSIYHLDETTYPPGSGNNLMTYALSNGEAIHSPGSIVLNQMSDMGWATSSPVTYSISGTIKDGSNNPINGVTVTLSGSSTNSTSTNSSGVFSFSNLNAGGNYTITPTKTNYSFSPSNRSYSNLSSNQSSANFTGTASPAISINPTSLSYGDVKTSQYSDKTITITNTGLSDLIISAFNFTGIDTASFHLSSSPSLPLTISPSSSYILTVRFSPVSIGAKSANLLIYHNAGGASPFSTVTLSGNGTVSSSIWAQNKTSINFDSLGYLSTPSDSLLLISNSSTSDTLVITSVTYTGGNNKFSLNENLPVRIAPNSSMNVKIRFNPDSVGNFSGVITFINNSSNLPSANLNVSGKVFGSLVLADKNNINFGVVGIGSASKDSTIEIINNGLQKLQIRSINLITADTSFKIVSTLPTAGVIINPSEKYTITVRLTPDILGSKTGTIIVNNNSRNNPSLTITLNANVQQSYLSFTPSILNFDSTTTTQPTKTMNIIIHNSSTLMKINSPNTPNLTITIFDKVITGDTLSFKILNKKTNVNLLSGNNDTIQILFYPRSSGPKNAVLTITSNDLTPVRTINLSGFGGGKPVLNVSFSSINYGDCSAGKARDTSIVIKNVGNLDLNITSLSFVGTDNSSFSFISSTSPKVLKYDETDTLKFRFSPSLPGGNKSAQLRISSNDPSASVLDIQLLANVKFATLYKNVSSVQFNPTDVGGKSDTNIIIKNTGNSNLEINSIYLDGAFYTDFMLGANYNSIVLQPNEERLLKISFIPADTGLRYARLVITSNDLSKPEDFIILRGTGKVASLPVLYVAYNKIDFGLVKFDSYKDTVIFISNNGNAPLNIDSLNIIGVDKNRFTVIDKIVPFVIQAGGNDNIKLRYHSSKLSENAILRIKSNDLQKPIFEISLSGNTQYPVMSVSDSIVDFGKVNVNDSLVKNLKIKNTGAFTLTIDSIYLTSNNIFTLSYPELPINISSLSEIMINIKFKPSESKNYTSVIVIKSNDPMSITKLLPIIGTGGSPKMVLSQQVDFGKVMKDNIKYNGFRIGNSGNSPLIISNISIIGNDYSEFEIIGKTYPYSINEGQSDSITIKWTVKSIGIKNAKVKVQSNDLLSNNEIPIYAEGTVNVYVDGNPNLPTKYELKQNYPNPFNPSTKIYYSIKENGYVSIKIFDVFGREINELVKEYQPAGNYYIDFVPKDLTSGVYFYTIKVNDFSQTRKMVFLK